MVCCRESRARGKPEKKGRVQKSGLAGRRLLVLAVFPVSLDSFFPVPILYVPLGHIALAASRAKL